MQNTWEANICQSWMGMEQNVSRNVRKSQITSKRIHVHEILWCHKATIPVNWCIRSRPGHCTIAGERQPKLWIWQSTRQCNVPAYCVCQPEHIQCGVAIQQHRKEGTQNSKWVGEVPLLPLCMWSTIHYRPHTIGSDKWVKI